MNWKRIATAAIRMACHERGYQRAVQKNRACAANIPSISEHWEKVIKSRRQLEEMVKSLRPKDSQGELP